MPKWGLKNAYKLMLKYVYNLSSNGIKYLLFLIIRDAIYQTEMFLIYRDSISPMGFLLKLIL
jgi:hypothetical protein